MFTTRLGPKLGRSRTRSSKKKVSTYPAPTDYTHVVVDKLNSYLQLPCVGLTGAALFRREYLSQSLLSKFDDGLPATHRRDIAIAKMLETEQVCLHINEQGYRTEHVPNGWLESVLFYATRYVSDTLGDLDYSMFEFSRFSSGASTSRPRKRGDAYYKYDSKDAAVHVTPAAWKYAKALVALTPTWCRDVEPMVNIIPHNCVTTVPKNIKTDRTIGMEPDMNMSLQLAVGRHIRKRLRLRGIDLNDQTVNQRLAKIGSQTDLLSTIDLSSASDSITYRLVMDLLPFQWFELLDDLRCPKGLLPNNALITWQKFSSMGNGFTFELETLLFAAICHGVAAVNEIRLDEYNFSVYGDDIIVPKSITYNVINALYAVGFSTNLEKTFTAGPFRESCGKHYYNGFDVTPFYIRSPINDPFRLCWFLNTLRAWSCLYDDSDDTLYALWLYISRKAPPELLGGSDIASSDSIASPHQPRKKLRRKVKKTMIDGPSALLRWFQSVGSIVYDDASNICDPLQRKPERPSSMYIQVVNPSLFSYTRNNDQWVSIPLFSKERNAFWLT